MSEVAASTSRLTPVQQQTLAALRRSSEPLVFDEAFIADLRDEALEALAHFTDRIGNRELFVTKHTLAGVFTCETQFLLPDDFSWTPARARGQVAHRAIQLLLNWRGDPEPIELVDSAITRLI
ncbi:MAG TPA: hypothetical protein PLV68_12650, partial [Ilumatobacteraceae bacterium]|nr:hypothetical protein [Ilumatobacteraceae bacterium]